MTYIISSVPCLELKITLDLFAAISTFLLLSLQFQEKSREQRRISRWESVNDKVEFLLKRLNKEGGK